MFLGLLAHLIFRAAGIPDIAGQNSHSVNRDHAAPIPVVLLTGFLASGKISLLNGMIAVGGQRTAVIVNEFGDVPIDNDLVQVGGEDTSFDIVSTYRACPRPWTRARQTCDVASLFLRAGE